MKEGIRTKNLPKEEPKALPAITAEPEITKENKEDASKNFMTVWEKDDLDYTQYQDGLDTGDGFALDGELREIQKRVEFKDGKYIIPETKIPKTTDITKASEIPCLTLIPGKMKVEQPKLAKLHVELNKILYDQHVVGGRSRDLGMKYEHLLAAKRKQIQEYCKNEGIDRKDYLRWNS